MEMTLQTTCFWVEYGRVFEGVLGDLDHFIEMTTRPTGIGPKYYVKAMPGNTWALAKWATSGGPERIIRRFDSEDDAKAAAEETYVFDIINNHEVTVHLDRESAEAHLKSIQAEDAA